MEWGDALPYLAGEEVGVDTRFSKAGKIGFLLGSGSWCREVVGAA